MIKWWPRAALISTAALAGCAVGPDYHPPSAPPGATGPFLSARADATMPDEPRDAWWRLYDDQTLDSLVKQGLSANQDLAVADANLRAAAAILAATETARYPATEIGGSGTYGRSELGNLLAADVGATAHVDWLDTASFTVAYQFDLFGQIRRGIEAARADAEAAEDARDAVRVTVAAQTAGAYADACALHQSINVAEKSLDLTQRIEKATERRHAAGVDTNLDLDRAQTLVAQTAAAIPPLQAEQRADLFILAALLGRAPARLPREAAACTLPLRLDRILPIGDGAALLRRRPDLRMAERDLAAATARIGVAVSDFYPSVGLGASFASTAASPIDFGQYRAVSFGLGPAISWTFPNVAVTRARVRQTRAGADAALARLDSAVLRALSETEQALTRYEAELDRHAQLETARSHSAEALRLAGLERLDGALPYLDLLSAEQTLIGADAALAASDRQLAADRVAVFEALGGGWQESSL